MPDVLERIAELKAEIEELTWSHRRAGADSGDL